MAKSRPKIVVLDGWTMNPGDLDWQPFEELGNVAIYADSSRDQALERAAEATALITNKVPIDSHLLAAASSLKYIGVTATGYDVVDLEAARARNVAVTNVPAYSTDSVAQLTFALLLELTNRVGHHSVAVKHGRWSQQSAFCFWDYPQVELAGQSLGLVGLGCIGRRVADIAIAFGMNVLGVSRSGKSVEGAAIEIVSLDRLLVTSDVVSLHCPLTVDTADLINIRRLRSMKPEAILINTSRGGLVNSTDLNTALTEGLIAGAALDVLEQEPPPEDHPLYRRENCIITPHLAWATVASRRRLMSIAAENLRAYLTGECRNRVD